MGGALLVILQVICMRDMSSDGFVEVMEPNDGEQRPSIRYFSRYFSLLCSCVVSSLSSALSVSIVKDGLAGFNAVP